MTLNPDRVRVKICGVRTIEEIRLAAEAGADAIGINFYPRSPRYVPPEEAGALLEACPAFVEAIAVVARPEVELLNYLVHQLDLRTVQIHDGTPAENWPAARYILAAGISTYGDLQGLESQLQSWLQRGLNVVGVLLDARVPGQFGGTGQSPPWSVVAQFSRRRPLILAGGLTPNNVADAIRVVRPWAVDVASGVEKAPGIKDPQKVRDFVRAVLAASALS